MRSTALRAAPSMGAGLNRVGPGVAAQPASQSARSAVLIKRIGGSKVKDSKKLRGFGSKHLMAHR
jgi:hypothetical protein